MDILFDTPKLQRIMESRELIRRHHGDLARKLEHRLSVLRASPTLADVPTRRPDRCHPLDDDRAGQFAVDLIQPFRLVFVPVPPRKGRFSRSLVTTICILEVVDYH